MSAKTTVVRNVRIIDPASGLDVPPSPQGGLIAQRGMIREVGPTALTQGTPDDAVVIDGEGQILAPGLVDMRVTVGEPGMAHKETLVTASRAAAAGGVTSMACLPTTDPVIADAAGLEFIARRAREQRGTKFYAYAAATRDLAGQDLTEYGLLALAGAVGFTDGGKAIAGTAVMRRALSYAHQFNKLIIQHPEEPSLAKDGHMNGGETATRLGLKGIPRLAEVMMIERDLRLVEMTGARYHAAHLSTMEAVEAIRQAKARGLPVSCDTAPHYFSLTEMDVVDYRTFAKVSPPLRTDEDLGAIIAGIADGTIDAIASDHMPEDVDSKRLPFAQAATGVIGVETMISIALNLYHQEHLGLSDLLATMTVKPAQLLGLQAGQLKPGAAADFIILDPDHAWRIDAQALHSKSKNSAFDIRPVLGRVEKTVIDGRLVYDRAGALKAVA
ncbi:MAG: dihydroorotase [Pseudomonadota bacterium]